VELWLEMIDQSEIGFFDPSRGVSMAAIVVCGFMHRADSLDACG